MGGYDKANKPYARLLQDDRLIDTQLSREKIQSQGIKFSCFDFDTQKT
jgi:hypothetical protein